MMDEKKDYDIQKNTINEGDKSKKKKAKLR